MYILQYAYYNHNMKEKILEQFEQKEDLYKKLGKRCISIFDEIIGESVLIHDKSFRVKGKPSLSKKIDLKGDDYKELEDITDICGIRIITFLDSDVEKVGAKIKENFILDLPNCENKRDKAYDTFGYRSLHFVVSLPEERIKHDGNRDLKGLKLEIQVRSILQHAWAEIEHDLGYKADIEIPKVIKRGFTRLSALLETADLEFDRLKVQIKNYQESVSHAMKDEPTKVYLDKDTLTNFIFTNHVLVEVREMFRDSGKFRLNNSQDDMPFIITKLKFFEFKNIHDLQIDLIFCEDHFKRFVERVIVFFSKDGHTVSYHTPLVLYLHFRACSRDKNYLNAYEEFGSEISENYRFKVHEYFPTMYSESE